MSFAWRVSPNDPRMMKGLSNEDLAGSSFKIITTGFKQPGSNKAAPAKALSHLLAQRVKLLDACSGLRRTRYFTSRKNWAPAVVGA
jgi:hypothetical protein